MEVQKTKRLLNIILKGFSNKKQNAVQIYFVSTQGFLHKCGMIIFHWSSEDREDLEGACWRDYCLHKRLREFCQENTLVIANTLFQPHKRRLYTWTSTDGQYRNQIDYILWSQRPRSSIQSAKTRPGADCGSDHELLISKFRLKSKKVEKTTNLSGMT